jgi:hypothetical protein
MALFGNGLKMGGSLALGAGVVLLAPMVVPLVTSVLKPVAKAAIKGSLLAYDRVKVSAAEAVESIEDLTAEAKSELVESAKQKTAKPKKAAASSK